MSELSIQMIGAHEFCESDDCDRFHRLRLYEESVRSGRERLARLKHEEVSGECAA
jgi:hypothetical protein